MFMNLTPHSLNVLDAQGVEHVFMPTTLAARVAVSVEAREPVEGFRVSSQSFGEVENLPAQQEGVTYIVSALVLAALKGSRQDVVAPDTGPTAVRENGQIKVVRGFVQ